MNAKKWMWGITLLVGVLAVTVASTYFFLKHGMARPAGINGPLALRDWSRELRLSAEQAAQLKPHEDALAQDLKMYQQKLAEERMVLCQVLSHGNPGSLELKTFGSRVGAIEADQQRRVIEHLLVMRDILTPDQKNKFFITLMQGICESCRTSLQTNKDMCGMCQIKKS